MQKLLLSVAPPLMMVGFLLLCVVVVLVAWESPRGHAPAKTVLIVVLVVGFALYGYSKVTQDITLQRDSTKVINERFFADVLGSTQSTQTVQTTDDVVWMSGSLPQRLKFVTRDSRLVKTLTGISSMFDKNTFVELVARMETFKKQYYMALQQYQKDAVEGGKDLGRRFVRYKAWSDLKVAKQSVEKFLQSLVHQVPASMQPTLFATIDSLSAAMQDGVARLKRMYAYVQ